MRKAAIARAQEHGHVAGKWIRCREIKPTVAVEICGNQRTRIAANRDGSSGSEGSITVAQEVLVTSWEFKLATASVNVVVAVEVSRR